MFSTISQLARLVRARGIKQREVAEAVRLSPVGFNNLLLGRRGTTVDRAEAIAAAVDARLVAVPLEAIKAVEEIVAKALYEMADPRTKEPAHDR